MKLEALKNVLSNLVDEDSEIVTLICGEDVTEEEQKQLEASLKKTMKMLNVKFNVGKQPVTHLLLV